MITGKGLLLVFTLLCGNALSQEHINGECYVGGIPTRCEPVRMSFSLDQEATASSTCGEMSTPFCVRSVSLGRVLSDCSGGEVCDANEPNNAHPDMFLTDFPVTETWWQSENSLSTDNQVVIDIPLLTLTEIAFVSLNFKSIKAAAFHLERSKDYGQTYQPYHYFALSCEDQFGIVPEAELTSINETSVLCQTIPEPPTPGTISFFPAIDRPSANDSTPGYSEALYRFTTATSIRVVLDQHYRLDLAEDDPGYYYALNDINVIGSCQCYGHASECIQNSQTGAYECVCKHNTTGTYCEQCQEFYQDVPWQRADGNGPFECKICNCNNHSSECVFDMEVYDETGQTSGGVCLNCDSNTDGRQCETCAPFYYQKLDRNQTDPDICEECGCSLVGVADNGECVKEEDGLHQPGDCYCKTNVMGKKCDMCILGYYNLSVENPDGCQACNCSLNGSFSQMCNHITGECECKASVIGAQCDTCRQNYYQPDPNEGCLPCDCNLGGSTSLQCDMITGQCFCLPGVTGKTCSDTITGNFFPTIDYLRLEGESANSLPPSLLTPTSGEGVLFTGTGYYRVIEEVGISNFRTLFIPVSGTYEVLYRYNLIGALIWNTATLTVRAGNEEGTGAADCGSGNELPAGDTTVQYLSWTIGTGLTISHTFCFRAGRSYTFILSELESGQASPPILDIDSLVAIPLDAPSLAVFRDNQLTADYSSCVDSWRRVATISSAEPICEQITFTFSTAINSGTLECDCDPDGSMAGTDCEVFGGQCVCLPGVRGRRCDECSPGTFDFSPTGCTSCLCNPVGSTSDLCQPELGTCECLPNVTGPNCSMCEPNFWGLTAGLGCMPCSCNGIGSSSLQCDQINGECACRPGVIGTQCDMCEDTHYRVSSNGCSPCNCHPAGSVGQDCEVVTGQCTCKENTRTRDCSRCISGTFNLQANNPSGCQPCFCSGLDTICSTAPGYVAANISTEFISGALDLQGWSILTTNFTPHPEPDLVVTTVPFSNGLTILPNSAFLQAPQQYLGNRLSSYLQYIAINLESMSAVKSTAHFDVILTGSNLQLGAQFSSNIIAGVEILRIQLHESFGWYHMAANQRANTDDVQTVLSSLENIYITASFNSSIILGSILLTTVEETAYLDDPTAVTWVEQCDCPVGYSNLSCQQCSPGYTRSPSGSCEPCQCNGFSDACDPDTGICTDCTGSTTGVSCEQCLPSTYGDPIQGVPCLPCPCPLTTTPGQFTEDCVLQQPNTIICLNCPVGHTGDQCESCSEGYFGDPTGENGIITGCSDCLCNGNINNSLPGSCNTTTGICLQCVDNTAGNMCEQCANGYFGDATVAKNCSACDCNPTGSAACDHQTGHCLCLPNVEGTHCDKCFPGYFDFNSESGCTPCNCNLEGSIDSQCHPDTGQCNCKQGVTGSLCDQCLPGFFRLSEDGCQACNCSAINSILSTCDDSGTCQCQAGSTGPNCESCVQNYFQDPQGCIDCPQCYQELEVRVLNTSVVLETTETILFNLIIETSPYEPRIEANQNKVDDIVDSAQMYNQQHIMLLMQVANLTIVINETLQQEVMELQTTIQTLKTTSTPVLIQALAAEELMNRTIEEFLMAQQEINLLAEFYLATINQFLSAVSSSLLVNTPTLQSLTTQVQLLSSQANQTLELVSELQSIALMSVATVDEIDSLNEDTLCMITSLQQNLTYIQQNMLSLVQQLRYFAVEIMLIGVHIKEQSESIPSIPSSEEVSMLHGNLSNTEHTIDALQNQQFEKRRKLSPLQDNLTESRIKIDSQMHELSNFRNQTTSLEDRTQYANNRTVSALNSVKQTTSEAEQVLVNLKNYNDDTFEVGRRANEALESVADITNTANSAIEATAAIQRNVSEVMDMVQEAMDKANDAKNITYAAQVGIYDVDTATLVSNISSIQSNIMGSRAQAFNLEIEAKLYQENLSILEERIDTAEELVWNGSELVNQSNYLLTQANSSLHDIQGALSRLHALDSSELQEIQDALDILDVSASYVEAWYLSLSQSLSEQKDMREKLQQNLDSMQDEVDHIRYLDSMLPKNCDSNI